MKILFVENHARFARIAVQEFLAEYEVTVVPLLRDARALLRTQTFDVVLLDYDLDDGVGTELLADIRSLYPSLRVIGVSSHRPGNEALLAGGADAVCSKLQFSSIIPTIDQVLEQRR